MEIISKQKISFASRLKDLMKEKHLTQEGLAEKLINPKTENTINVNSVKGWLSGIPLTRNKEDILNQLANIFDVDPAYLECKQTTKKLDFSKWNKRLEEMNIGKELARIEAFEEYIKSIGFEYKSCPSGNGTKELSSYIYDGYEYTVAESIPTEYSTILTYGNESKELSESEFNNFMNEIEEYTKFKFLHLK